MSRCSQYPAAAAAAVLVQRGAEGAAGTARQRRRFPAACYLNNRGLTAIPKPIFVSRASACSHRVHHSASGARRSTAYWPQKPAGTDRSAGRPSSRLGFLRSIGLPFLAYAMHGLPADLRLPRERSLQHSAAASKFCRNSPRSCSGCRSIRRPFIARERCGPESVGRRTGQTEAAYSLGLRAAADSAAVVIPPRRCASSPAAHQPVSQPHQEFIARRSRSAIPTSFNCSPARC